jgi:hypothetical protein
LFSLRGFFHSSPAVRLSGGSHPRSVRGRSANGAMLAFLLLVAPGLIRAQQTPQILHNHLRAEVTQGTAPLVGPMPAGQRMRLSIVLPLRNQADLKNLLARLYDPSSPDYRHFLTVDEFTQRYGPTADDYRVVVAFAQADGLTVTGTPPNRLIVPVSGTVDQVERAFNVQMNVYQHPAENRTFFSPDREPSLNLSLPIAHISGLNDFTLPRPMVVSPQQGPILSSQLGADANGSGPDGSYLASDMRGAYYGGATLDGTGQTVGLLEFDGYDPNDVTETFAGQSYTVPINNVLLDGATGAPVSGITNGEAEVVLDIVQAIGMAPGLSQVRVYIGQPTDDATILNKMATENIAKQISCSWSWGPDDPGADDPFFEEFAAQGQSFFTASGDSGAYPSPSIPYYYPAEDDFVTAVGGTDLTTVSAGGAWSSEMAWSDSGGGVSPDSISIPGWQSGVADAANGGSTTLRNVPDVAMEADFDNYVCSLGSCQVGWGGTSFAAPRWAAFMALINQQAVEAGTAPMGGLGFLDPSLYALAGGSSYGNDLHDIISGNNNYGDTPTWYNAVAAYDLVTGWGSPNGANLINGLAGPQVPGFWLRPSVASLQVGSGTAGASTTIGITDAGGFTGGVNLAVSSPLPAGVTASWGTNPASGSSVLTLAAASDAPAANANLTITGTAGQLTASATVAVSVHAPTFLLTATPNAVSVSLSSPATTTVLVTPQYGFTGSVNLSVSGLPSGVTASFSPNPTNGSSTLTLTAAANAPSGTVTATLKGASGSVTASATFSLTVLAPFVIVSPTNVSLGEGGSAATAVGVNSLGFTGSVNLSLSGLPAGVTGTFATNPLPVTSNTLTSSQLTLTATSTAVLGQYTLTVTGTSGALSASNTFTLAITAPKSVATVTVSPSSSSIATSQSLPVSVSVSGNGGELVAAGSVSLSSGSYTSGSATLIDGSAIITIPAGALSAGSDTVTVSYSGDSIYNPATASTTVTATAFPPINPAQTAVNLGTINVGSTSSSPTSITFDFTAPVSVGSTAVVTQGAQGLDFIDAGGGTCDTNGGNHVYKAGDTCTVNVTFAPNYPGARNGAVNLINSGIVIATALIYGIGDGAQLTFQSPNSQSTIATGVGLPGGVAVDGGGNVYFTNNSQPYQLFRATPSNGSYVVSVIPTSALLDPRGIAVDGAGNIYIADDNWRVLKETATASGYTESTVASFPVIGGAFPVGFAVDGAGNVAEQHHWAGLHLVHGRDHDHQQSEPRQPHRRIEHAVLRGQWLVHSGSWRLQRGRQGRHRVAATYHRPGLRLAHGRGHGGDQPELWQPRPNLANSYFISIWLLERNSLQHSLRVQQHARQRALRSGKPGAVRYGRWAAPPVHLGCGCRFGRAELGGSVQRPYSQSEPGWRRKHLHCGVNDDAGYDYRDGRRIELEC